jgi:hypothetical protein
MADALAALDTSADAEWQIRLARRLVAAGRRDSLWAHWRDDPSSARQAGRAA